MKIFQHVTHVNFVDEADTFVGYDLSQDCCENAEWDITPCKGAELRQPVPNVDGFLFDRAFFEDKVEGIYTEDGGIAIFKLVKDDQVLYLRLWNIHNGYYGHAFEVKHNGQVVREGNL